MTRSCARSCDRRRTRSASNWRRASTWPPPGRRSRRPPRSAPSVRSARTPWGCLRFPGGSPPATPGCASPRSRRSRTSPRAWAARSSRTSRRCATPRWPRGTSCASSRPSRRNMLAPEIIRKKRDGSALTSEEIAFLVGGITDGGLSDAQAGALALAFFLRGLDSDERVALTTGMRDSGTVLDWDLDRPVLDKHSTGGVGDKVSLILAPILAACGAAVPMISGRGLGHTGGTLDKLDSIPGYASVPATEVIRRVVRQAGGAVVGQTADLAPADRRLYAVRDAKGTVESISLIVASILSKKLAEGLDGLVLYINTGKGAFMAAREDAEALARALVEVATGAGLPTVALLTDM